MTDQHIKVYSQLGNWFAECPCNAYCKTTSMEGAHGWASDHRDEHRAARQRAPEHEPANFDATVHIVYGPDGVPVEPGHRYVDIDLADLFDSRPAPPAWADETAALAVGA